MQAPLVPGAGLLKSLLKCDIAITPCVGVLRYVGFVLEDGVRNVSYGGWEFVPDLAACFSECQRVLRPGGLLVVCTVHPLAAFEWGEDDGALLVTDYFNPPVEVWGDGGGSREGQAMTFFHTLEEMFTLLTSSGFAVVRVVEPYPCAPEQISRGAAPGPPYSGAYWQTQYERFRRVPFAIVYVGRKE